MDAQVKRLRELAKKCQVGVPRRSTAYEELHFVLVDCYTELHRAADALERLDKLDREAATHVETVIVMRTHFTGEPPYVGWKGLGLALNEALDERDRALERQQWVSVEERLPEIFVDGEPDWVLVVMDGDVQAEATFRVRDGTERGWRWDRFDVGQTGRVTHWSPLPPPPDSGSKG